MNSKDMYLKLPEEMINKDSQWDKESWLKEELEFWWLKVKKLSESEEMGTEKENLLEVVLLDKI